jgi:hypothetical protein
MNNNLNIYAGYTKRVSRSCVKLIETQRFKHRVHTLSFLIFISYQRLNQIHCFSIAQV